MVVGLGITERVTENNEKTGYRIIVTTLVDHGNVTVEPNLDGKQAYLNARVAVPTVAIVLDVLTQR